jgi:hypothetical protein
MNPLEEVHRKIDESDWDAKDDHLFNEIFQETNTKLVESNQAESLHKSEKEREVFAFGKTPDGLKWKLSGTKTLEDGSEVPFNWPDLDTWKDKDYDYILERFWQTKNRFARSEYGLLLFYKNKLKNLADWKTLFEDLMHLADKYYTANKGNDKGPYYSWHFYNALANAIHISEYKRNAPGFGDAFEKAIKIAEQIHKEWSLANKQLLRIVLDMSGLVVKYYNIASTVVDVKGFYDRNLEAANELNKTYTWGAIYIIDKNIELAKLAGYDINPLIKTKAELFEKLALEAENTPRHLVSITFIETALRLYKEVNDAKNIERLEKKYDEVRGTGSFSTVKESLPEEETARITDVIDREIEEKDGRGILENFIWCPMYASLETIEEIKEEWKKNSILSNFAGSSVVDKFGNTIVNYPSQSEDWAFLQAYGLQFQIGTQTLLQFFIKAIRAGKLNYEDTIKYLEETWMNEPIPRIYNQRETKVIPLELLKFPLKSFFHEITNWINQPDYIPEIVSFTDSLVLKVEAVLRYFCDRLNVLTFKQREGGIVMEKNLDEILADIAHKPPLRPEQETNFDESDRRFIKYIMSDKAGENLRNRIAHGLLDINEYSLEKPLLAFTVLMRLSKYKFR